MRCYERIGMTFRVRLGPQSHHPFLLQIVVACLMALAFWTPVYAVEPRDYAIEASVEVLTAPLALRLTWVPNEAGVGYTIRRRVFGTTDWGPSRASLPGSASEFTDTEIAEGTPYEYEIRLETSIRGVGGLVNAHGYLLAGANVSWPDEKGKVLLVVESSAATALSNEINAFQRDLVGAGWYPIRRDLQRLSSVSDVKNLIRAEHNADPANLRSVILLGHVPVPYSGNIAPDLHESHRGAWPADVYYADMDGTWTDNTVNIISGDYPANDNRPGDGKFDQSQIPSSVELEIGRIDFFDMPAFGTRTSTDLLRNYLRKNSEFRHRLFTANRRMLVRDNFGDLSGDAPAVDAWRHYRQMFGPDNFREIGANAFFPTLQNESFLWAYGGGGGGNTKADTVGTTWDFAAKDPRAVFLVLHGSYFGDWNTKDNFLRAAIGSQSYTLASIWSGLPHWFMHPMGLGRSVGHSTRLTQNNVSDYKTYQNFSAQQVHISLIGDPTLENFPVIPPKNLVGSVAGTVNLRWESSPDESIVGYHVYFSHSTSGPFQRLTASPLSTMTYAHQVGTGTHHYMVRAVKLERTGSGTFYNLSQGIFTSVTKSSGGAVPQINITADDATAGETGPDTGAIRITRSFADENALVVDFLVGGTAQNGSDYSTIGSSIVIPAWESQATITITPLADNVIEGDETVTIQIRPSANYTVGSPPSALLKIADGINHPPTISQIPDQTIEAGSSSANLAFNISDPETAASDLAITGASSNEQIVPKTGITLGGSGATRAVRISPAANASGVVTIILRVTDGVNHTTSSFDVTVTPPNLPPTALSRAVQTLENTPIDILLQGEDPEGQPLTYSIKSEPAKGTLTGTPPTISYTPATNYFGSDSFTFTVRDSKTESAPAQVSINITPRNRPPVALDGAIETLEDRSVNITLAGTDPDDDVLQYEIVLQPRRGKLSGTGKAYVYHPDTNIFGADSFTFRVADGEFVSSEATVSLAIAPVNDVPVAENKNLKFAEDGEASLLLSGSDPDHDPLSYAIMFFPTNGTITGTAPNLTYRPATNFHGSDILRYVVSDGSATSAVATVWLTIDPVNDAPVVFAQNVTAVEDTPITIRVQAADAEDDTLAFRVSTPPQNGRLTGTGPDFLYTPDVDFNGEDGFYVIATDGKLDSLPARVNIEVEPRNDPPIISPIAAQIGKKNSTVGPLSLDLKDPDRPISDLLVWAESSNSALIPTNRITFATALTNRQMTFLPNSGVVGDSTITIYVFDGQAAASISFLLSITNTPPLAVGDQIEETAGIVVIPVSRLLANDQDADGDTLQLISVTASDLGKTVQLTNGAVVYHGNTNVLQDAFSYVVEDTSLARSSAIVSLRLTSVPRITSVQWLNGGVHLRLSGPANRQFHVLASHEGGDWILAGEGTSDADGRGQFMESGSESERHRLYRVEWP